VYRLRLLPQNPNLSHFHICRYRHQLLLCLVVDFRKIANSPQVPGLRPGLAPNGAKRVLLDGQSRGRLDGESGSRLDG
jgi:hypothetical protein